MFPLVFRMKIEALSARFEVTAPPAVKVGQYSLRAVVTSPVTGDENYRSYGKLNTRTSSAAR